MTDYPGSNRNGENMLLRAELDERNAVLANLSEQLWGPPHEDNPHHWRELPATLAEELAEDEQLRNRMSELLTGVAAGLKGPPPPLVMHDWSDLPALAEQLRAVIDELTLILAPSSPTGVVWPNLPALARADLRGREVLQARVKAIREHTSGFACWWGMTEAQEELGGTPIPDSAAILHFSGSGASTMVTAREIRRQLATIYGFAGLAAETPEQAARREVYEDKFAQGLADVLTGNLALSYPARFTPGTLAKDGHAAGYVVTFRDIPEAITQGDDEAEASAMAVDALATALDFYFEDGRPVPAPSAWREGDHMIALPAELAQRVTLHNRQQAQTP